MMINILLFVLDFTLVLCGPGNNGGDGFVIARLLKLWGWDVDVFLYGDAGRLPADARTNYQRWIALGPVLAMEAECAPFLAPQLVIDACFGTGATRGLPEVIVNFMQRISSGKSRFVGVDCFSGDDLDSGHTLGNRALGTGLDNPLRKDLTVSFHSAKVGHYLDPLAGRSTSLKVKDIGLPESGDRFKVQLTKPMLKRLHKGGFSHKFSHGHALILSGGPAKTGAARLAARGALRIGAGLVTLGVPPSVQMEVAGES